MRMRRFCLATILSAAVLLDGCAFGYNRVLFVTKTNVGFEATSTPPAVQLAIARTEGVIAPQFQSGSKLPVLASFRFSNAGFFAPAVGSAFTTGDAAITMAALYADRTPHANDWEGRVGLLNKQNSPTDSTVSVKPAPTLPRFLGIFPITFQGSDVRPVFFGTDTSLGIKIAWSGATGEFPDSARFGYNRTELALVPIAMKERDQQAGTVDMRMSSLMATIDAGVTQVGTAARPGVNFDLVQYFATGRAATLMALQQDVRKAMLARLDPHKEERKRDFEGVSRQEKTVALSLLPSLYTQLAAQPPSDVEAKVLVGRMDAAVPAAIAGAAELDFKRYDYSAPPNLTIVTARVAMPSTSIGKLVFYDTQLARAAQHLQTALADPNLATLDGAVLTAAQKDQLKKELDTLKAKLVEIDKRVEESRAVFRDAVEYFYR